MKYKKQDMLARIVTLAALPPGRNKFGFFTKEQVLALYLHLVHVREELDRLKERVKHGAA